MEIQSTTEHVKPIKLDDEQQKKVVNFILEMEGLGKSARAKYEATWDKCHKAYHQQPDPIKDENQKWQSNLCLPWARDAVDSATAYLNQTLLPKGDQLFTITGRTQEDHPGAKVMEEYMTHVFERNGLAEQFAKLIKLSQIHNHPLMKVYWKNETRVAYEWVDTVDPLTGEVKKVKASKEIPVYNNVWFDLIELKDFVFYPVCGDFEKTTRIHTTYRYLDELQEAVEAGSAPYFNLDKLETKDEEYSSTGKVTEEYEAKNEDFKPKGIKLKEAIIPRIKIGKKICKNYLATIADDQVLIRFQPNPDTMGKSSYVFKAMNPIGNNLYGDGLLAPGLELLDAGNRILNGRLDEINLKLNMPYKFYDDDTFNANNVVNRPGALVEVADVEAVMAQLQPVNPAIQHLTLAYSEVAELKIEFENVTVPKAVKGMIEQKETTATEINTATQNSMGKMHVQAGRLGYLLQELMEKAYQLIYERMQYDETIKEDIARITQEATKQVQDGVDEQGQPTYQTLTKTPEEMVDELPEFLPLPEVDVKIIGYQNQIRKEEQLVAMREITAQAMQTPELSKHINGRGVLEAAIELSGLDKDRMLTDEKQVQQSEQQQAEAAQKQQELMMQVEMSKMQSEAAKLELEKQKAAREVKEAETQAEIELIKLAIEKIRLGMEAERSEKESDFKERQMAQNQMNLYKDRQLETNSEDKKE